MKVMDGIPLISKISLSIAGVIMMTFFIVQTCIVFGVCEPSLELAKFGLGCIVLFIPPFYKVVIEFIKNKEKIKNDLSKKNIYLEHAAKIIRHDMHSGINTYIPRGLSSLQRRLDDDQKQKLRAPLQLLSDGVKHAQKVYNGVYEFTNLVKDGSSMSKQLYNVKVILNEYLSLTAYKHQVLLDDNLPTELELNEPLFCTAIDNLIRNGLKYNNNPTKWVKIYYEEEGGQKYIAIQDNGRGMSQEELNKLSKPYIRKEGQLESGSGLGLNICNAILNEHKFKLSSERVYNNSEFFKEELDKLEEKINWQKLSYIYNREALEGKAKECNYKGIIEIKRGGRKTNRLFVQFTPTDRFITKGTKLRIKI